MWQSNESLGREYIQQAEVLEADIARLRQKKPRSPEDQRKLRRKIDILETMLMDTRRIGVDLIHYDDKEDVNDQTRADAGAQPAEGEERAKTAEG